MRNYFNYFTELEEYFSRKRGRNLLISPLDWSLIELWKQSGVPLHVALRGIDRSFESSSKRRRQPPRTLFYCHPAVMEAFDEYREVTVGRAESDVESQSGDSSELRSEVVAFLENLEGQVRQHRHKSVRRRATIIRALRREVGGRARLLAGQVDRDLATLSANLARELAGEMSPDELGQLDRQVASQLKPYRKRLAADMIERLEQNHRERLILQHFELPELTLI